MTNRSCSLRHTGWANGAGARYERDEIGEEAMDFGITGKVALVVGGSKGIGFETAKMLAAEGCRVAVVARTQKHIDRAVEAIRQDGGDAVGISALARAAAEMSDAYRAGRAARLDGAERLAAYLVTRMPATYAAAHAVLGEVRRLLGKRAVESVLDIGAGAGAAS